MKPGHLYASNVGLMNCISPALGWPAAALESQLFMIVGLKPDSICATCAAIALYGAISGLTATAASHQASNAALPEAAPSHPLMCSFSQFPMSAAIWRGTPATTSPNGDDANPASRSLTLRFR